MLTAAPSAKGDARSGPRNREVQNPHASTMRYKKHHTHFSGNTEEAQLVVITLSSGAYHV